MPKPLAVVPDLEEELDGLYETAPADFISVRNDLARRLKQAGQAEAAELVQGLRKPTVPVWVVNQLARRRQKEMRALLAAGEKMRAAQEQALAGETQVLRQATAEERTALRALTERAHELLTAEGHGSAAATLERIASTLRAAATDPAGREQLAAGRLGEELSAAGFGALVGMKIPAPSKRSRRQEPARRASTRAQEQAQIRKLRDRARNLTEEAATAEREARSAEAAAASARRKAEKAAAAAERARASLEDADRATRP